MIKIFAFCLNFLILQKDTSGVTYESYLQAIQDYKPLLADIREYKVTPEEARERFQSIMLTLKKAYPTAAYDSSAVSIIFPLQGFDYRAVGGRAGNGYKDKGYDLFDQNAKGSHPAHDIFIKDKNQDCKDDRTGDYVGILSVCDGIVIGTETEWQPGSEYRGGNYIWVFDTVSGGLWYYAHQKEIYVKTGDTLKAGQRISIIGRTGYNAYMKRSDTHLHLTYLRVDEEGNPFPVNTYGWLKNAATLLDARIAADLKPFAYFAEPEALKVNPKKLKAPAIKTHKSGYSGKKKKKKR
ncbi:M23 family metallopeptidase [Emticicia sp. TH156]|uniref:M23 family metallopeptidase n=1 Tax=Emticicia sp. TH156 TaxID=2067454 RepID=UPI000C76F493|nr:M23 family metallopeptidase [Emticicia sp. TH156]PLK43313.1 M23 family peptidase [Emticicia sp. TH156]